MTIRRIRPALVVVLVFAAVWAAGVAISGGFFWQIGSFRISSRDPWRPLMVAIAAAAGVLLLTDPARIRSELDQCAKWLNAAAALVNRHWRRGAWTLALAIAVAGIAIDVYQWSGALTFWLDEEMVALNFRDRSFAELTGSLWLEQSAPYGWLVLQRAVLLTLGDSELALRLVPLLFGVATVVGALWVGRRWLGPVGLPGLVLLCWISPLLSHYRFEVKHYTADIFFGLMLPALAAWAIEGATGESRARRALIWWIFAAAGQFFANGALLVAPGCAAVLLIALWRRDGWRALGLAAAGAVVWLGAVAGHYELSLRYTSHLRDYWADQFPPGSAAPAGLMQWFVERLERLAGNPAGTALWPSLWLLAPAGFVFGRGGWLKAAFAIVVASVFVYAFVGVVPLYERFSIWIVPALYVGIMLLADRAARALPSAWQNRQWVAAALSIVTIVLTVRLASDVVVRGYHDLDIPHPSEKQQLNDRAAVRWLLAQQRSGDTLLTTRLGWPAIWWYGGISIAYPDENTNRAEGYEMTYETRCTGPLELPPNTRRLLVYLGFPDVPNGFESVLKRSLDEVGVTTRSQKYADRGRTFVVDLDRRSARVNPSVSDDPDAAAKQLPGCIGIRPLRRW